MKKRGFTSIEVIRARLFFDDIFPRYLENRVKSKGIQILIVKISKLLMQCEGTPQVLLTIYLINSVELGLTNE